MELKAKKKPKFIINIKVFKFTNLQHGILNNLMKVDFCVRCRITPCDDQ